MKKYILLSAIFCLLSTIIYSQISEGGKPISFSQNLKLDNVDLKLIDKISNSKIQEIISENEKNGQFYKIGQTIPVNININNSGTWQNLPDGGKIWRLIVKSQDAKGLVLYYNNFYLPNGSKFFVYNQSKTQILGAYTSLNNSENGSFANEMIQGDIAILEYYQPAWITNSPIIELSGIGYIFRGVKFYSSNKNFGDSDACQVNVNCAPEGDAWQTIKKGVVRILLIAGGSQGWCSGSVINNVRQDCAPYILTADHCGEGATTTELNQWIFYFNYESPTCTNPTSEGTLNSQTMTGCTKVANGGSSGDAGSDFYLVRLASDIPTNFNAYFNGWDRRNVAPSRGVSIHHPSGDIKKISTYTTAGVTSGWNGSAYDSHWKINWATTTNGTGVTEGGSSGSPLFNQNKKIVGDLTGGGSYCTATTAPDYYGKFSYSWETNGTTPQERLKDWLDPDNTGRDTLDGSFCGATLYANFTQNTSNILVTNSVNFTDMSAGNPTAWKWTFEGGTPATSTVQNPTVQYNSIGTFDVKLVITKGTQKDSIQKIDLISVTGPALASYFKVNRDTIAKGQSVNYTDTSYSDTTLVSWLWTFEGATPATSTLQNPIGIKYDSLGLFDVKLKICNQWACDSLLKTDYIVVIDTGGVKPTANFAANFTTVLIGNNVNFSDLSTNNPTDWEWTFTGGVPSTSTIQNPSSINYPTAGTYPVKLVVLNAYGSDTLVKTGYITVTSGITTQPPVANFQSNKHIVQMSETVNFTDKSTGGVPATWSWAFSGATPATSTVQHPLFVQYDSPGAQSVSLTVTNTSGTSTKTIDEYIFVTSSPTFNFCDSSVVNVQSTEALVNPKVNGSTGYMSGHNGKNISAVADYFDFYIYSQIKGLIIPVAKAHAATTDSKVKFKVWSVGSNGLPGTELGSKEVKINTFNPGYFHSVMFDNPISIYGNFFVGYELYYTAADTFSVYIAADRGTSGKNTMYLKQNNAWVSSPTLYTYRTSTAIKPISCITGIEDEETTPFEVFIYPNPTTGNFNIEFIDNFNTNKNIDVFNIVGENINCNINRFNNNSYNIDISQYANGIYFIKINTNKGPIIKRVLLQK